MAMRLGKSAYRMTLDRGSEILDSFQCFELHSHIIIVLDSSMKLIKNADIRSSQRLMLIILHWVQVATFLKAL